MLQYQILVSDMHEIYIYIYVCVCIYIYIYIYIYKENFKYYGQHGT